MVDEMLVVPEQAPSAGIERERRVVIEVLLVGAAENELRRGDRHGRSDVDPLQHGIVARHHPRADVPALLHGHTAPRLIAGLARPRNRARAPQLLAGGRIVRRHDAGFVSRVGLALPARDDLAVGDDRTGRGAGSRLGVVHRRLPDELPVPCVDRVQRVVAARIDHRRAPNREVAVRGSRGSFRKLSLILPQALPGPRVERLHVVASVRHIHDAAIDQRRAFLIAGTARLAPHLFELRDVALVDCVEWAVGPAVERSPPAQPVSRIGILEHLVGHRDEVVARLRGCRHPEHECDCGRCQSKHGVVPPETTPLGGAH